MEANNCEDNTWFVLQKPTFCTLGLLFPTFLYLLSSYTWEKQEIFLGQQEIGLVEWYLLSWTTSFEDSSCCLFQSPKGADFGVVPGDAAFLLSRSMGIVWQSLSAMLWTLPHEPMAAWNHRSEPPAPSTSMSVMLILPLPTNVTRQGCACVGIFYLKWREILKLSFW